MGSKGGDVTIGYRYYMGLHFGVAHGPVDQVQQITVGEREAWAGTVSSSSAVTINAPELFGGEKKEGGILGTLDVCMGESTQTANSYLASKLGSPTPAFRGILSFVWRGGMVSAMNPYIKPWAFKVKRILQGWSTGTAWYAAKAEVGSGDMNPAHIVYECLTNSVWGMGYATGSVDSSSFTAAADALYTEGFGLSMAWTQQSSIESFIKVVLDHIGGVLYVKPDTGLFALKLIRADYVKSSLPLYGPSNLISATDYQRQAWGETINEVTVVFTDRSINKKSSVTVQDLANITNQGGVVSQSKPYPGISNAAMARRLAMRDLLAASTPLARVKLTANRTAWATTPGDVIRLTWPAYGVSEVVFRVLEVNRGTLQDGTITIDAIEDVFGLPTNTYVGNQGGLWTSPNTQPAVATNRKILDAPYWDIARSLSAADLGYLDANASFVETLAVRPSSDSVNYDIQTVVGAGSYALTGVGDFVPTATLVGDITPTTTSMTVSGGIDLDLVTTGKYIIVDNEYMALKTINTTTGAITVDRGVLDTVPVAHSNGARIWFGEGFQGKETVERANGETVSVKLLPRTGLGTLALASAPIDSIAMARRQNRPYPPGNFKLNGNAYPATITGTTLTVTWAHRDRLQQTAYLNTQSEGNIGPEAGTTYSITIYNQSGTVLQTATGITGTSYSYTIPTSPAPTALRVVLSSVRGGVSSHQAQDWTATIV
jgi:hypothetical protein